MIVCGVVFSIKVIIWYIVFVIVVFRKLYNIVNFGSLKLKY